MYQVQPLNHQQNCYTFLLTYRHLMSELAERPDFTNNMWCWGPSWTFHSVILPVPP